MAMLEPISPLAATLERVAALDPYLRTSLLEAPVAGWMAVSDLLDAPELWLDAALDQIMARYAVAERKAAATFFMGSYSWYVGAAALGCYLAEGRVPSLAPEHVAVNLAAADGRMQVALLDQGFAALPGDPAAADQFVRLVGDAAALGTLLRTQIEAHMAAMITLIHRRTSLGQRAQWNLVADACAELCLRIGEKLPDLERGCAEGLALIKAPGSPLQPSRTSYLTLAEGERCQTFRLRGGCCLYYKTPGGTNCSTCPLIAPAEQEARLRAYLAASA